MRRTYLLAKHQQRKRGRVNINHGHWLISRKKLKEWTLIRILFHCVDVLAVHHITFPGLKGLALNRGCPGPVDYQGPDRLDFMTVLVLVKYPA